MPEIALEVNMSNITFGAHDAWSTPVSDGEQPGHSS
jgi:hypothetical protein